MTKTKIKKTIIIFTVSIMMLCAFVFSACVLDIGGQNPPANTDPPITTPPPAVEWNAAVLSVDYEIVGNIFQFSAVVVSLNLDQTLRVQLLVDGSVVGGTKQVQAHNNQEITVNWLASDFGSNLITSFEKAEVRILKTGSNSEYYDNFVLYWVCTKIRIQLVSARSDLWLTSLSVANISLTVAPLIELGANLDMLTIDDFVYELSGFCLYIFDGVVPSVLPTDGAVWFVNLPEDLPNRVTIGAFEERVVFPAPGMVNPANVLFRTDIASPAYKAIIEPIQDIFFEEGIPWGITWLRAFVSSNNVITVNPAIEPEVLLRIGSSNGSPALVTWEEENGQKMFVMPFNLEFSSLPVTILPFLFRNILEYIS